MNRAFLTALLGLSAATALVAQEGPKSSPPGGHWNFGLAHQSPDFSGAYDKTGDTSFDTDRDLGLGKDSTGVGGFIDYEGPRFLLHMGTYNQTYAGDKVLQQDVTIGGTTFPAGSELKSKVKLTDYELDWTIKVYRWDAAYLGVDLGFNGWNLDVSGVGTYTVNGVPLSESASTSGTVPIPQLGASAGGHIGRWADIRGYYNFLSHNGATYHRAGVDVRFYPLSWLGLRANYESEGFNAPKGTASNDTAVDITKNGVGFGVLARF